MDPTLCSHNASSSLFERQLLLQLLGPYGTRWWGHALPGCLASQLQFEARAQLPPPCAMSDAGGIRPGAKQQLNNFPSSTFRQQPGPWQQGHDARLSARTPPQFTPRSFAPSCTLSCLSSSSCSSSSSGSCAGVAAPRCSVSPAGPGAGPLSRKRPAPAAHVAGHAWDACNDSGLGPRKAQAVLGPGGASVVPWRPSQQLQQYLLRASVCELQGRGGCGGSGGAFAAAAVALPPGFFPSAVPPRPHAAAAAAPFAPLLRAPRGCAADILPAAFKLLGFSEPSTLQLALHCFARVTATPTMALAAPRVRSIYGVVTVWVAAKLEERRSGLADARRVGDAIGATARDVAVMEVEVMQLLDWSPYRGYVNADVIFL